MPDLSLQRKTAILVDAPRSIWTPFRASFVLRDPLISGTGRSSHALLQAWRRAAFLGLQKKVFGA